MEIRPELLLLMFAVFLAVGLLLSLLVFFLNVFRVGIASCSTWLTTLVAAAIAPDFYFIGVLDVDLKPIFALHTEEFRFFSTGGEPAWTVAFLGVLALMTFCFFAILALQITAQQRN